MKQNDKTPAIRLLCGLQDPVIATFIIGNRYRTRGVDSPMLKRIIPLGEDNKHIAFNIEPLSAFVFEQDSLNQSDLKHAMPEIMRSRERYYYIYAPQYRGLSDRVEKILRQFFYIKKTEHRGMHDKYHFYPILNANSDLFIKACDAAVENNALVDITDGTIKIIERYNAAENEHVIERQQYSNLSVAIFAAMLEHPKFPAALQKLYDDGQSDALEKAKNDAEFALGISDKPGEVNLKPVDRNAMSLTSLNVYAMLASRQFPNMLSNLTSGENEILVKSFHQSVVDVLTLNS